MACVSSVWAPRRRISCSESCDPGKRIVDAVTSCMVVCSWRKRLLRKHLSRQAHRLFQLLAVHDFRLYLSVASSTEHGGSIGLGTLNLLMSCPLDAMKTSQLSIDLS